MASASIVAERLAAFLLRCDVMPMAMAIKRKPPTTIPRRMMKGRKLAWEDDVDEPPEEPDGAEARAPDTTVLAKAVAACAASGEVSGLDVSFFSAARLAASKEED